MASHQIITKLKAVLKMLNKLLHNKILQVLVFLCLHLAALGQENKLSIDNVLDIVRNYHPIVKQSSLRNQIAKNELTSANSIFDPTIQFSKEEKTFDNKFYYQNNNTELKIPLWYGIDVKAGIENNIGERLDPSLSMNNSSFVGVGIDPFRGLLVDKRKSIVKQAQNMTELTKNEQLLVVNDLMLDAITAYWNWANAYYNYEILNRSVKNNTTRFEIIKKSFIAGDRAPIDTTEALTQLQTFEILENQALVELQKARFELNNFFWTEKGAPYEIADNIKPATNFELNAIKGMELNNLEVSISTANQSHPKIRMMDTKLNILDIEKRMKTVELFPSLKLNYNALDNNYNFSNITSNINTKNNFKYGVSISMPLFQRQARGELSKTSNKIQDVQWDRKYINLEIENKIKGIYTEFYALKSQINTNEAILGANKLLFETENTKFQMGESSLFLINSRELKLIETEQKSIALKSKLYLSMAKRIWAMGNLN
jgi:outer membrane protein TolC